MFIHVIVCYERATYVWRNKRLNFFFAIYNINGWIDFRAFFSSFLFQVFSNIKRRWRIFMFFLPKFVFGIFVQSLVFALLHKTSKALYNFQSNRKFFFCLFFHPIEESLNRKQWEFNSHGFILMA